ncbi:hypothetical protein [Streptomyces sp. AA1529]|uniref:hypothetical protein n=1 Tax=Streptomyces sp. AA1529 TaxID=1203257 RepID=UPI001A0E16E4|nr:hypothetical protein [Streptomyces sp. GKU 257-1]
MFRFAVTTRTAVRRSRARCRGAGVLALCASGAALLALVPPSARAAPSGQGAPSAHAAPARPTPQIYEPPAGSGHTAARRHTGPEIHRFLTWFYGTHGPDRVQREHFVSDLLKRKQARHPDRDVLLCAQNTPQDIEVGPVTTAQSAGVGWATVTARWADGTASSATAYVALDSHPIELHDVVCAQ